MPDGNTFFEHSHLTDEGVALYVDALKLGKTDQLPREVREHVAGCQECRKNITGLFALVGDQESGQEVRHPYFDGPKEARPGSMLYRIAAALVAVAGVGVLAYYVVKVNSARESLQTELNPQISRQDSAGQRGNVREPATGEQAFAANFTPFPELEDMVGTHSRSSQIEVRSPKNGATVRGNILFDWQGDGVVTLELVNNKGMTVYSAKARKPPFVVARLTPPGLYYWKLQSAEEILYVGKFFAR